MLINHTADRLILHQRNGDDIYLASSSGAHITADMELIATAQVHTGEIDIMQPKNTRVVGLPEKVDGVWHVVDREIAEYLKDRDDLVYYIKSSKYLEVYGVHVWRLYRPAH